MKLRSTKLLRAVTFSSLAALTGLIACGDGEDEVSGTAGSAGSSSTAGKAGASSGGSSAAGNGSGGSTTGGGGTTSVAGNTTAGAAGTAVAGSGGSSVAGAGGDAGSGGDAGGGGAGGGGDAGAGGDTGGGGDTSAGAGGTGETAGAGGMGGAPDVPEPTNLSIGKVATASTEENNNGAANAIDGDVGTRWCASNGDDGNWIIVDLGASHTLTGAEIVWEMGTGTGQPNAKYKYTIELSADNVTWTPTVDQSANVSPEQTQAHAFSAGARYLRVTVLDIVDPAWLWACAREVRVLGY